MKARIPNQGGQANMMKRLQQMQEDMARVQQECEEAEYSASAGGGAIDVTVNGKHQVVSVKIQPDVVDPEDVEMLEDLLVAAVNEAMRIADETTEREMGKITGGRHIAGLGF